MNSYISFLLPFLLCMAAQQRMSAHIEFLGTIRLSDVVLSFLYCVWIWSWQKSTSISRYIEEHVQRTGVAIETQGFAFVTSGKKRESLTVSSGDIFPSHLSLSHLRYYSQRRRKKSKILHFFSQGNATLHLYPHFKPLAEFPGKYQNECVFHLLSGGFAIWSALSPGTKAGRARGGSKK